MVTVIGEDDTIFRVVSDGMRQYPSVIVYVMQDHGETATIPGDPESTPELPPDGETVKAIAEQAVRSYTEELNRSEGLDRKTGVLLGATGAIMALAVGTLAKPLAQFDNIAPKTL